MQETFLIQRLRKPHANPDSVTARLGGASAFGGGLVNGGLSKEALRVLRGIFSFDYMGSSEFEWGAVPKALNKIASNFDEYDNFPISMNMDTGRIRLNPARKYAECHTPEPTGLRFIYVICHQDNVEEVEKFIQLLTTDDKAMGPDSEYPRLKEPTLLEYSVDPLTDYDGEVQGWLELDNGFMFFLDARMYADTVKLFSKALK